ncbi:MAG TPA: dihydrofolate reductase [Bacillota bacterium]|nr:dihydrofolate reductase [Bacillota bacterium]
MISLLVAMDNNRVIGLNNDLPWHLPNDLKFFKQKTTNQTIIMGRKTYESIGKPLPNRKNIVLTNKEAHDFPGEIDIIRNIEMIMELSKQQPDKELFVIGGANVIKQVLPFADRMYITWIDDIFEGDTFFPAFSNADWKLVKKEKGEKNERNPYDYYFLQYDRK